MDRPDENEARLRGRRVLIVEDSPLVSEICQAMLEDLGCVVVGPAVTIATAMDVAASTTLDAAVVDINIRGGKAFPLLRVLDQQGVPFILATGYGDWSMPDQWTRRPRLAKPYTEAELCEKLLELVAPAFQSILLSACDRSSPEDPSPVGSSA